MPDPIFVFGALVTAVAVFVVIMALGWAATKLWRKGRQR